MKILLSWIAKKNDMIRESGSDEYRGPTLEVLRDSVFDLAYLFSNDEETRTKALNLKSYVDRNSVQFRTRDIKLEYVELSNPADYKELWEEFPKRVEKLLKTFEKDNLELFINVSAGTPAMTTTWMMMVGTGQIQAKLLNSQLDPKTNKTYVNTIDIGVYPFVATLQDKFDSQLKISQKFKSPQMRKIMRNLTILAESTGKPILILGETGTGKTWLAKQFHQMTGKDEKLFYKVVCGEFKGADSNVAKSALFGHMKGAFTGATESKEGYLSKADGGTLFLDEIGDIPWDAQRLLIDAVESGLFRPLSSNDIISSKFQLICATNRNITEMLERNELSQDFYNRISIFKNEIPPIRERSLDIPILLDDLLQSRTDRQLHLEPQVRRKLIDELNNSFLPGNIRDIDSILENLWLKSQQPSSHVLDVDEVIQYFEKNPEPTQDEEFSGLIQQLLQLWPNTKISRMSGWKDALLNASLEQVIRDDTYRKGNGDLNYNKISKFLGISNKTAEKLIKKRVDSK
jgi:DNA-binding NtrC family response regulator